MFITVLLTIAKKYKQSKCSLMDEWIKTIVYTLMECYGPPWGLSCKESSCQCRRCELGPWVGKIPWKGNATHSSICVWEIPRTEEIDGYSLWSRKRVGQVIATKQQEQWCIIHPSNGRTSHMLLMCMNF